MSTLVLLFLLLTVARGQEKEATLKVTKEEPSAETSARSAFERYKIIYQKQPFGAPEPVVEDKPEVVDPVEPDWIKEYRLSMLREAKDGSLIAGLVKKRDNQSITLKVGESYKVDGIELVAIDMAASEITLKKGGDVLPLKVNPDDFKIGGRKGSHPKPGSKHGAKPGSDAKSRYADFAKRMAERRAELSKGKKPPPAPNRK